jgi:NADH-quinone oxidoreductase subunit C
MSTSEIIPGTPITETAPQSELVKSILALDLQAAPYEGHADCPAVQVPVDGLLKLLTKLRHDPEFNFDMLSSHTAVDRLEQNVFELVYYLYSLTHQKRLLVSVLIPRDNPVAPTCSGIWKIAEWQEREVYDLLGVCYDAHPDLRRVFLEDDWQGFPLRKDYHDGFMLTRETTES